MTEGSEGCTCKMRFASPEKFNDLIDHSKPGLPVKGVGAAAFVPAGAVYKTHEPPDRASAPLARRPCASGRSFEESTILTMYTVAGAISALANNDPISRLSASYTVDGDVSLGIKDVVKLTIRVKDHHFTTIKQPSEKPRVIMEFADIDLAHGLFTGTASTLDEMCRGTIYLSGMISMADNLNRILDRVSLYLA